MRYLKVEVTPHTGTKIEQACSEAKELSEFIKQEVTFLFNGVSISTYDKSINDMVDSYLTQRC